MKVSIDGLRADFGTPPGAGPFPGVVVLHEIWGLNDDIRSVVTRFCDHGYAAVAPDLYSDGDRPRALCIARTVFDMAAGKGRATLGRLAGVRRWLEGRPEVDGDRLGVIGFCMGGGFALLAGVQGGFGAAAVNYGTVPSDPAELAGVCPVVASYGGTDRQFARQGRRLRAFLTDLGVAHDVKEYPGVGHSFLNQTDVPRLLRISGMKVGYSAPEADDAWRRTFEFFDAHVKASGGGQSD